MTRIAVITGQSQNIGISHTTHTLRYSQVHQGWMVSGRAFDNPGSRRSRADVAPAHGDRAGAHCECRPRRFYRWIINHEAKIEVRILCTLEQAERSIGDRQKQSIAGM